MMFLQGMQKVQTYSAASTQLIHDLEQQVTVEVPSRFRYPQLPVTLGIHPAVQSTTQSAGTPAHLNVAKATDSASRYQTHDNARTPPNSTPRRSSTRGTPRGSNSAPRGRGGTMASRQQKDVQCAVCATYGHEVTDCQIMPKVAACLQYIKSNQELTQTTLQRYRQLNHPAHRPQTYKRVVNALAAYLPVEVGDEEMDEMASHITESLLFGNDPLEDDWQQSNIYSSMHATAPSEFLTAELCTAIHPAKFPLRDQLEEEVMDVAEQQNRLEVTDTTQPTRSEEQRLNSSHVD